MWDVYSQFHIVLNTFSLKMNLLRNGLYYLFVSLWINLVSKSKLEFICILYLHFIDSFDFTLMTFVLLLFLRFLKIEYPVDWNVLVFYWRTSNSSIVPVQSFLSIDCFGRSSLSFRFLIEILENGSAITTGKFLFLGRDGDLLWLGLD